MRNSLGIILSTRRHRRTFLNSGVISLASLLLVHYPAPLSASTGSANGYTKSLLTLPPPSTPSQALARLPLAFEANRGQIPGSVKFIARARNYMARLNSSGATLIFTGHQEEALDISFTGSRKEPRISALEELPGKTNYLRGRNPASWKTGIPNYSRVKYHNIYPGIDLVYYGNNQELEYDFIVAPRAATRAMRLRFDGASGLKLDAQGDLILKTSAGELRQRKPVAYQQAGGARREVEASYVIEEGGEVAFQIGDHDSSKPLVIDPVLTYSKRFGGGSFDEASAITADKNGNSYITGNTSSSDFPTVSPAQPSLRGFTDIFVMKLNAGGDTVLYSTFIGGISSDMAFDIAVDKSGKAYVTGSTRSLNFPVTPGAFQTFHSSRAAGFIEEDAFVTKLNESGSALVYSTFLGGNRTFDLASANNRGLAIAVDSAGNACVGGSTSARDFPIKKALQPILNKGVVGGVFLCYNTAVPSVVIADAFVTKLNRAGSGLVFSTYFGGTGSEEVRAIALDSADNIYIAGRTCSRDFPIVAATQGLYGGDVSDGFVSKLSASGRSVIFSTFIGGSGRDSANGVAVDSSGAVAVAGETTSDNLPTTAAAIQPRRGGSAAFRSPDEGSLWVAAGAGLPNADFHTIAVDPFDSSIIYAGTTFFLNEGGLFKSTDQGVTWNRTGLRQSGIRSLYIDPRIPSTLYAATLTSIQKSTDGGATWTPLNPIPVEFALINKLAIDPQDSSIIYVAIGGASGDVVFPSDLFKSTDGGATWHRSSSGLAASFLTTIQIDPKNSSTVYVGASSFGIGSGLYKSTDGGASWNGVGNINERVDSLAIDPEQPSILYAGSSGVRKSTDGGLTFGEAGLKGIHITALAIDPGRPLTVYAGSGSTGGGVFRSTDGGASWAVTDLKGVSILALAIDPQFPSNLFAGASQDTDAFIAKYLPTGQSLAFSTYLGHWGRDRALGVGIDAAGKIYAAGETFSFRFPVVDALQAAKSSGPFATAPFITKLDSTGERIRYSTYFEGEGASSARALAVDAAGKAYIAGEVRFPDPPGVPQPGESGNFTDAFVAKISTPPVISAISIRGNKLFVTGEGFDISAVISIDGVPLATKNESANLATLLLTKEALGMLAPGRSVIIQVRNPDGLESQPFPFTRPL